MKLTKEQEQEIFDGNRRKNLAFKPIVNTWFFQNIVTQLGAGVSTLVQANFTPSNYYKIISIYASAFNIPIAGTVRVQLPCEVLIAPNIGFQDQLYNEPEGVNYFSGSALVTGLSGFYNFQSSSNPMEVDILCKPSINYLVQARALGNVVLNDITSVSMVVKYIRQ